MNEARRFFRYVIPGLLFFSELFLYLFFSANVQFVELLKEFQYFGKELAFPVTLFLVSGGVGFF